jgi:hypothetical protein
MFIEKTISTTLPKETSGKGGGYEINKKTKQELNIYSIKASTQ